ncbi:MAG: DsbA family oxidoreductase, partial [Pseudomonadota bacterium]
MSSDRPKIRVDIVSDVVCPWCVIGYYQLQRASDETGIEIDVHWHPFELNPTMGAEGENLRAHLAAKYGTTPEGSAKAREKLTTLGAALGFQFNYADDMRMVNTFRAHQLIDWAALGHKAHAVKLALFEAFFTHRDDLNDPEVLVGVAESVGLDRAGAAHTLSQGTQADIVREKQAFWTAHGITGVPAMVFERRHLVTGAQGQVNYG